MNEFWLLTAQHWNETVENKMEDPEEDIRAVVRNRVRHCILSIFHQLELHGVENGHLENAQYRLEWLLSLVTRYHEGNFIEHGVVDLISEALGCLTYSCEIVNCGRTEGIFTGSPGRPKFNIPYKQLNFMLEIRFTVVQISALLGVSSRTVERRLQEFGLSVRATYADISEEHLDSTVNQILATFPNTSYKRMSGYLRTCGIRIQQRRNRESMQRVDPQGTLLRALEMNVIHRRVYSVPSPLALWHIDGNHKLIR